MTMTKNTSALAPTPRAGARSATRSSATLARRIVRTGIATTILAFVTAIPALAQPALWAIRDADSTIYLMGTVHLLKPQTEWKTEKLTAAIGEAQDLWLELPTTNPEAMSSELMPLISKYGLSADNPLSKDLTVEEMKTLDEAARLAGLTGQQLDIFRPWFAALTISTAAISRAGFDPASGVDSKIEAAFRERGLKPKGLETLERQLQVFASLSRDQELAYLRETIEQYRNAPTELDQMVDQWSRADLPAMERMFIAEMKATSPDLYAALLTNRNANWATQITDILKGKGVSFIAVGAAHLVGDDSVLALLKAKGVDAERVQ